jgi:hypothetical protein
VIFLDSFITGPLKFLIPIPYNLQKINDSL